MTSLSPRNLYWDSCVFIRYITRSPEEHVADIAQYISEAKAKRVTIHFSTIAFAEIKPRFFRGTRFGTINDFFDDLGASFVPTDPNPNIMIAAGQLRDNVPTNPSDPRITEDKIRVIGTADAIHLMTATFLRDSMGVTDLVFHTFDKGKGKTWEGNCVPLIDFERWYPEATRTERVAEVCGLTRTIPSHPEPDLATRSAAANAAIVAE